MKKNLLLIAALVCGFSTFAQFKLVEISDQYKNLKAIYSNKAILETMNFSNETNPTVAPSPSKAINEALIGTTRYDLQSNKSVQNRIYLYNDGTIGATYTFGITNPSFADRGTGYNYYNGSIWGAVPTARIETVKSGWPSYAPLGANGEIIVSHNGSTGLLIDKRTTKGTGAWTQSVLVGPTTSGGTTALLWPRMITSGNTIHIISCTDQATSPNVWYYQGLALALVYIRSTNGGTTWDAPLILPGMDAATIVNFVNAGFGGDSYGWANPVGDTIAFFYNDGWKGMFVMKSLDGGTTWTKTTVFNVPQPTSFPTAKFHTTDGSGAIALDNNGIAHVAFGRMRVNMTVANLDSSFYYPYTDGLIYWNENMPALDTAQLGNLTGLNNAGQLVAIMEDYNSDATINFPTPAIAGDLAFGKYFTSLSSFPQIQVDGNGIVFVSYSQCREDKIDANGTKLLRHLFIKKREVGIWSAPTDLTGNIIHDYDECIFGSMSYTSDTKIHIVYQADDTPGLAVRGDETPYSTNFIYYINILKTDLNLITGINENNDVVIANIYPNPAVDDIFISLNNNKASKINVFITNTIGQEVLHRTFGQLTSNSHTLQINIKDLSSGIYFLTVDAGNERATRKIIVE